MPRSRPLEYSHLAKLVSESRLRPYLDFASGRTRDAVALYEWNSEMGAALWDLISYFEVSLRNAIARELESLCLSSGSHQLWFNRTAWFSPQERKNIREAKERVRQQTAPRRPGGAVRAIDSDLLVPHLMFGFWVGMLDPLHANVLWIAGLQRAFPNLPSPQRGLVRGPAGEIGGLRNMIAHHDPLLKRNILSDEEMILRACYWIDCDLADWLAENSQVRAVHARRPNLPPTVRFSGTGRPATTPPATTPPATTPPATTPPATTPAMTP